MKLGRTVGAFLVAAAITYSISAIFYTERNLAEQALVGIQYTSAQQVETYISNFAGLWKFGAVVAIALLIGFLVAFGVKRVLRPLAPIAYPAGGAAAIYVLLLLVETQLGGGAGIIGGARTPLGVALQCLAGFAGGLVFAFLRPRAQ